MLDFMIISLPRSGSTWACNWMNTEQIHCVHDPLWTTELQDLDSLKLPDRMSGIACTGLWRWPKRANQHPARKLILHRDPRDVQESMVRIGLPTIDMDAGKYLERIEGWHVPYHFLFDADLAAEVWAFLTDGEVEFDRQRHAQLIQMNIQPRFDEVAIDPDVTRAMIERVRAMQ